MDDLATLFIGNNLQLASTQPPPEEFAFERRSNILTPNLVAMLAFLAEYTPQLTGWTPPDATAVPAPDAFGYDVSTPNGYLSGNGYGGMTPNGYSMPPVAVGPQRPFDLGLGHPLHYAQFIAPEAGVFQRPVYPPTYTLPLMNLEASIWPEAAKPNPRKGARAKQGDVDDSRQPGDSADSGRKRRPKSSLKGTRAPKISIDYSPKAVTRLLDLQPETGGDMLSGFLHGRLFTNDQDNFNYMTVVAGEPDVSRKHKPLMVACYRRNFISIHLRVKVAPVLPLHKYRLEVLASEVGDDPEPVSFFVAKAKSDTAKSNVLEPVSIAETHVFSAPDDSEIYFSVKKLQFKSATANNINLNFQTYFQLRVRLYDGEDAAAPVLASLASCPIVVRGRNPSFYEDRRDVLIAGRAPALRESYVTEESETTALETALCKEVEDEAKAEAKAEVENESEAPASDHGFRRGRYHYFPMLNVYYMPPINVVYFPHGAHQATDRSALRGPPLDTGLREPKVYFR